MQQSENFNDSMNLHQPSKVSQFWKFCYGTGDIGKFLKGKNIPKFCDHVS